MIVNYLKNLNIRSKLMFFLVIPVLTILYFSISSIHTKFQERNEARNSLEFISISFLLADVIFELQRERGFSSGFVSSLGEKHKQELQTQRRDTDEKLEIFFLQLSLTDSWKNYPDLADIFLEIQQKLNGLSNIRLVVDHLGELDYFEEYSNLISTSLIIPQHLQTVVSDVSLARQSISFTSLLELMERSGQERGLLNGIFATGQLNIVRLKEISAYISEQRSLINNFYTVALVNHRNQLRETMKHPVTVEIDKLRRATIFKASRNNQLNQLLSILGYGGLIHDFKNYLIRGRQDYINNFNNMYIEAMGIINNYRELPDINNNEIQSLNTIKTTLLQYQSHLEATKRLKEEGQNTHTIDSLIKVNDQPAILALKYLHNNVSELDTSNWWDVATTRIGLIQEVSNNIRNEMYANVQSHLAYVTRILYIHGALVIFSLLLSFVLGFWLLRRIVDGITDIASHMSLMQHQSRFDTLLTVDGTDEISEVAQAFNSLISERQKSDKNQKQLHRQLLQAQKMESLGQLTGGIAHDFNNMLSAILGYTSLAIDLKRDDEKLNRYLNEVTLASNRAQELIAQMLAFSREDKKIDLQVLNIDKLFKESIKMIRPLIPSTIEFEVQVLNEVPPIFANPVMMNQIFMNLCINARDAIVEHGRIDFRLSSKTLNKEVCSSCHMMIPAEEFVELSIQDSGLGIESKILNNLFDPFFTTKEIGSTKGTGMGLAMVHGIMHSHKGHIIVESTLGKGSKFRLLFPHASIENSLVKEVILKNKPMEVVAINQPVRDTKKRYILLVDDEKPIIALMTEVLINQGYQVTAFSDSELALSHFRENSVLYDLVLTDQTMPKLTGMDLSKAIFQLQPNIPIILCSGYSEHIDKGRAHEIGIQAYMNKPLNMKELFNTINQLLTVETIEQNVV